MHGTHPPPAPDHPGQRVRLGRRAWLEAGSLALAATALDTLAPAALLADDPPKVEPLRIGLITDLHYADKPAAGSRYYRETPDKLAEAARHLGGEKPAFVVELGDLIDAADSVETELRWLGGIQRGKGVSPTH